VFAAGCVQGYARTFAELGAAADALRLKGTTAQAEVARIFKEPPVRCEAGAYVYFLDQLMAFARRALKSGATPETPKEGWVRAAGAVCAYAPKLVPQAEYSDDMQRFQAAKRQLQALVTEAGAGPQPSALLLAFDRAAPSPGGYGPPPAPPPPPPVVYQPVVPARISVPNKPLPDWAVVTMHEVRDLIQKGQADVARAKVETIIRWIETQR
jgi:hypothetical protein